MIEPGELDELAEEVGLPPLAPWQREVALAALNRDRFDLRLRADTWAYRRAAAEVEASLEELVRCLSERRRLQRKRIRMLYRQRQLAKRRKGR